MTAQVGIGVSQSFAHAMSRHIARLSAPMISLRAVTRRGVARSVGAQIARVNRPLVSIHSPSPCGVGVNGFIGASEQTLLVAESTDATCSSLGSVSCGLACFDDITYRTPTRTSTRPHRVKPATVPGPTGDGSVSQGHLSCSCSLKRNKCHGFGPVHL